MWFFRKAPTKSWLQDLKAITINGHRFTIKKVNPMSDFTSDKMPQIFSTGFMSIKQPQPGEKPHLEYAKRVRQDMMAVVEAGLVKPELVAVGKGDQKGKEQGITIEDIARDETTFTKLYWEIWLHSLNKFRGIKSFFFNLKLRYLLWTSLRAATGESRPISSGLMEVSP